MAPLFQAMIQERDTLRAEGNGILDLEERSPEQQARLDEITARVGVLNRSIETETQAREALRTGPAAPAVIRQRGETDISAAVHYIRTGDASGLAPRAAYNDVDMVVGTPAAGGVVVPTGMFNGIIARRDELAIAPRLGVRPIPGTGLTVNVPVDDEGDVEFTAVTEASDINRDSPALNQKAFTLVKYGKYIPLTWELLRDEDANLIAFINDWVGRGIAATENKGLVTEALANGTAGLTLDAAAAIGAAEVPELVGKLAPEYQDGAQWLMKSTTLAYIQQLKGDPFYFAPPATAYAGKPSLWGYPVQLSGYASAITGSAKSLIFGNWYYMGRRQATTPTMLRDPYTSAGKGIVKLWFWVDFVYGVLQAEAIQYATHPSA